VKKIITVLTLLLTFSPTLTAKQVKQVNQFAATACQQQLDTAWRCLEVGPGERWTNLFPDPKRRMVVQMYNRQNRPLRAGQKLILPPESSRWLELSPVPQQLTELTADDHNDLVVFDPKQLAWAHYVNGRLKLWGPAVGGKSWCPDVRRSCRTKVGTFYFTEAASPERRSSSYPKKCQSGEVKCAAMAYFIRFTNWGQGIHRRSMSGANASHGCIGVFEAHAQYINNHVRSVVGKSDYGYFNRKQNEISRQKLVFLVLPY
jgi:L,D-transpeptidase ErfK/SrfK